MGASVNVGRIISLEIKAILDAKRNRPFSFSVLITHLCHNAGVDVTCLDPTDRIRLQLVITEKMYALGEMVKKGQRQEAEDDADAPEFDEIEHEQE